MKYFFNYINFIGIIFLAYMCVVFQSTLLHQFFGIYKPTLFIILISYLALNRFAIEGGIIAYITGYFIELNSGSPFGFYSCVLVLTFYLSKLVCEGLLIKSIIAEMGFVVIVSVLFKLGFVLVLSIYESVGGIVPTLSISLLSMAFLNFLLTPIVFWGLKSLDKGLEKELPSKTATQEGSVKF